LCSTSIIWPNDNHEKETTQIYHVFSALTKYQWPNTNISEKTVFNTRKKQKTTNTTRLVLFLNENIRYLPMQNIMLKYYVFRNLQNACHLHLNEIISFTFSFSCSRVLFNPFKKDLSTYFKVYSRMYRHLWSNQIYLI